MCPVQFAHFGEQVVCLALHEREVAQVIDALAVLRHVVIAYLRLHHIRTCERHTIAKSRLDSRICFRSLVANVSRLFKCA